jgi:hypothetical protein
MTSRIAHVLFLVLAGTLAAPVAMADGEDRARKLCKQKITDVYDLKKFQHTQVERVGNHKFQVHGQVRFDHHWYDFQCRVKQDQVKSYAYHGPHNRNRDGDVETALAVGAGLAIVAAIASAHSDDDRKSLSVPRTALEDDCHDILQYRIRDEHDRTASVTMRESHLKGRDLSGEARVDYHDGRPHKVKYTCHFDRDGQIKDSSYRLH